MLCSIDPVYKSISAVGICKAREIGKISEALRLIGNLGPHQHQEDLRSQVRYPASVTALEGQLCPQRAAKANLGNST